MHLTQEHQHITCEMSQGTIALFILVPAPINLPTKVGKLLIEPYSFSVIFWQGIPQFFIPGNFLFQFINLPSGACLSAIKAARKRGDEREQIIRQFLLWRI